MPKKSDKASNEPVGDTKSIIAAIKRKLVAEMKKLLLPQGFVQTKNAFWNRYTKTMRHSFEFRQLKDKFDVRYGYLVLDKYGTEENYGKNMNATVYSRLWEKRWGLPQRIEEKENFIPLLIDYINEGIAFLGKYMESSRLVADYDSGLVDKSYFAEDPGWQSYHLGTAYYDSKKYQAAVQSYQDVIDNWSGENLEFIQTRKRMSELWIREIKKQM